jgi:hypothetical protein
MTYDPSVPPPSAHSFTEAAITYEDTTLPRIAIAPADFTVPLATMWVRSHGELMMFRDGGRHWALVFFAANNSVEIEGPAFWRITDVHDAASRMRKWLDDKDLIPPEDLQDLQD